MAFYRGDKVEVCSKEEGFVGSFYEAKILRKEDINSYSVQYRNLVTEEDSSIQLIEKVSAGEVRPKPPRAPMPTKLCLHDVVDAFDNDGWWVGRITGKKGTDYYVFFDSTGDEIAYPIHRLRFHLAWVDGKWVSCKNRGF
ncbi:protein AGENET DOMAIN (AGD)-CONTAINING P1 [Tripterygium wilfordii]|nr:protein AGENET DOMAIN (AGD)-CONTAINING P1 [Tripterygium wilfordii]